MWFRSCILIPDTNYKKTHRRRFKCVSSRHRANAGIITGHRLRRWPEIMPAMARCPVMAASPLNYVVPLHREDMQLQPMLLAYIITLRREIKGMGHTLYCSGFSYAPATSV